MDCKTFTDEMNEITKGNANSMSEITFYENWKELEPHKGKFVIGEKYVCLHEADFRGITPGSIAVFVEDNSTQCPYFNILSFGNEGKRRSYNLENLAKLPTEAPHRADQNATIYFESEQTFATSYDSHYKAIEAKLGTQPIQIMEFQASKESIPPESRLNIAIGENYITRAGTKDGEPWEKDVRKAMNHYYRALHGKWPWNDGIKF